MKILALNIEKSIKSMINYKYKIPTFWETIILLFIPANPTVIQDYENKRYYMITKQIGKTTYLLKVESIFL